MSDTLTQTVRFLVDAAGPQRVLYALAEVLHVAAARPSNVAIMHWKPLSRDFAMAALAIDSVAQHPALQRLQAMTDGQILAGLPDTPR